MSVPIAIFGINSSGLNTAVKLVVLFLVVIWLALVYYSFADGRRRMSDPILVGCATAASFFFPFVGTVVYTIVRPPEFLEDQRERELEIRAAEARINTLEYHLCPHCDYVVEKDFVRCPSCLRKLRDPCGNCARPLDPEWKICPYCEHEIPGMTPQPRRRRRPRAADEEPVASE
jgi:RNA polymerase subunit RPABC4/transcription elongation factor Spt4